MRDNLFKESALDVLDGVQSRGKCSNNPRRLMQGRKVINDVEMFVSSSLLTER